MKKIFNLLFILPFFIINCSNPENIKDLVNKTISPTQQSSINIKKSPEPTPTPTIYPKGLNVYNFPVSYDYGPQCTGKKNFYKISEDGIFSYVPSQDLYNYDPPGLAYRKGSRKLTEEEIKEIKLLMNETDLDYYFQQSKIIPPPPNFNGYYIDTCSDIDYLSINVNGNQKLFSTLPGQIEYPPQFIEGIKKISSKLKDFRNLNPGNQSYEYSFPFEFRSYKSSCDKKESRIINYFFLNEDGILNYTIDNDISQSGILNYEILPVLKLSKNELEETKKLIDNLNIAEKGEKVERPDPNSKNKTVCINNPKYFSIKVNDIEVEYKLNDPNLKITDEYKNVFNELENYLYNLVKEKLKSIA
jgi:hypothetical protein